MNEQKRIPKANRRLRDFAFGFAIGGMLLTTTSAILGFMILALAQALSFSFEAAGFTAAAATSLVCALCGLVLGRDGRLSWAAVVGASAISFVVALLVLRRADLGDTESYALVAGVVTAGPALLLGFALASRRITSVTG